MTTRILETIRKIKGNQINCSDSLLFAHGGVILPYLRRIPSNGSNHKTDILRM